MMVQDTEDDVKGNALADEEETEEVGEGARRKMHGRMLPKRGLKMTRRMKELTARIM